MPELHEKPHEMSVTIVLTSTTLKEKGALRTCKYFCPQKMVSGAEGLKGAPAIFRRHGSYTSIRIHKTKRDPPKEKSAKEGSLFLKTAVKHNGRGLFSGK